MNADVGSTPKIGEGCRWVGLAALSDDSKAVVVEGAEAIGSALDEFHFAVEAFGDAIVSGEAPHAGYLMAMTLNLLHRVAKRMLERHTPKSPMGEASGYLLRQWGVLVAHLEHGETRWDNNLMENAIRPTAIGKKNWLFIGHPDAGQRSAVIYSIVVSCQRRGIDPMTYLRDVLGRLPAMTTKDDIEALTPKHWAMKSASATTAA